ncbi:MAG: NAD+ synthase [Euryarchaeota archaeon]|nr:NAD+ synthase [Euryarchaeota archaeon]
MNPDHIKNVISPFIRVHLKESGASGAVIGLSGGIDSTITAYLTTRAIGAENVLGILLPIQNLTPEQDTDDAIDIADRLGIEYRVIEISGILRSFSGFIPDYDPGAAVSNGNLIARIRMCVLYYYANILNRMVIGTGNRTELLIGYSTKYGDSGVDIEPIGDLYKTEVFELARHLGVPKQIIEKLPSARLWAGQTDEGELGMQYKEIDRILRMLVDEGLSAEEVAARGVPEDSVSRIANLVRASEHKRHAPPRAGGKTET